MDCNCLDSVFESNHVYNTGTVYGAAGDGGGMVISATFFGAVDSHADDNLVINNQFRNNLNADVALHVAGGAHANNNWFVGNLAEGTSSLTRGMFVTISTSSSAMVGTHILDNNFSGYTSGAEGSGIFMQRLSGTVSHTKIVGNKLSNNDYGLVLEGGITDTEVINNDVTGNGTLAIFDNSTRSKKIGNRQNITDNYYYALTPIAVDQLRGATSGTVEVESAGNTQLTLSSTGGGSYRDYASFIDSSGNHFVSYDIAAAQERIKVSSAGVTAVSSALSVGTSVAIGVNPAGNGNLRMPNNGYVFWRNFANNSDIQVMGLNTANILDMPQPVVFGNTVSVTVLTTATADHVCYNSGAGNMLSTCSSLRELKTNIAPLTGIEGTSILSLQPSSFSSKSTGQPQLGFIAEEVYGVDPRLATYYKGQLNGVNYDAIVAALVKMVQDQERMVQEQDRRIRELERR